MKPRDYQQRALDELFAWFEKNKGNPLMVLPTAAGKSLIIAMICQYVESNWPGTRVIMLTHVKELIEQNFDKLKRYWPEADAGIYSAGIGRRDLSNQIIFAGIQSIADKAHLVGFADLVLIDEAHTVNPKQMGRYRSFLDDLQKINPHVTVIGLTATPYRMDSGYLWEGNDAVFTGVAAEVGVIELLEKGYLSPIISKATGIAPDLDGARTRLGDYVTADLEKFIDEQSLIEKAVEDAIARSQDRKKWIFFTVSVNHAVKVADMLNERGYPANVIHGETPKKDRKRILADYHDGKYRALANCNVLSTGFDEPAIDMIAMLRPTQSTSLYVQQVGRGMRLANGKTNCLLLDYAGNVERHGCIDDPNVMVQGKGDGSENAPVKTCPKCENYCHAAVRHCPHCGYQFPPPELKIKTRPDELDVVGKKSSVKEVSEMMMSLHRKPGKPLSIRVDYFGLGMLRPLIASEWVCLEHVGFASIKARTWWTQHGGIDPVPETTEEAMRRRSEIMKPHFVTVRKKEDKEYPEIASKDFGNNRKAS